MTSPSADAVDREAAWLASSGDGLPALLTANGGPWDVVQSYWPRTPSATQTGIYLIRNNLASVRFSSQRRIETNSFRAKLWWPIGSSTTSIGVWEAEQADLDAAVALLLDRIYGYVGDHTHGGRFLSVAEAPQPGRVDVQFSDPETTVTASVLTGLVSYQADDRDFTI